VQQPDRESKSTEFGELWAEGKIGEFDVDWIHVRVLRIVRHLARVYDLNDADSEDIAIEIMVSLIKNGFRGVPAAGVGVYLASIARNRIVDRLRSQIRERRALSELQRTERAEAHDAQQADVEALVKDEKLRMVEEAMASLNDEQRAILFMRYYENLTLAQIAQRLDKTYSAVAARTFRALQKLRSALLEEVKQ
jgi:RNA polymerase sigma-70 factor (ECF subfamily)